MAQTIAQVVTALATSDSCAIVSMRSPKATFMEIMNDYDNKAENAFAGLQGPTNNGATRLVIVIDRQVSVGEVGSGVVNVERRS